MAIRLPSLRMDYLRALTDDTGMFQFARFSVPRRDQGYTTDDNARALIACIKYHRLKKDAAMVPLANIYLSFLQYMQKTDGAFHNFLSYDRRYLDVEGSDDCVGRALWGCGCALNSSLPRYQRMVARDIFDKGLPRIWKSKWPRAYAFTILGLTQYYQASPHKDVKNSVEKMADYLLECFKHQAKDDWRWFENVLTYDNARLPQALFEAYQTVHKPEHLEIAKESMDFFLATHMVNNVFVPIGNEGWYKKGASRAFFAQQPLEATALVDASIAAFYSTNEKRYIDIANKAFEWFLGANNRNVKMYCEETAGCFDGLTADSVNLNQGAESSISYVLARLKLEEHRRGIIKRLRG